MSTLFHSWHCQAYLISYADVGGGSMRRLTLNAMDPDLIISHCMSAAAGIGHLRQIFEHFHGGLSD